MVRKKRLELLHLAAPEHKSGASTNFATSANFSDNPIARIIKIARFVYMVRKKRLELLHLAAPEPKSGASTNFATSANFINNSMHLVRKEGLEPSRPKDTNT